ncbi:MAG: glyoxalase/bleomycin resistance/dioxygenase family protein [Deltaproteobacteria bacterium]|nr:glyoxalase/bleomycin resistance/dioxygenase family protein [Deltaproteobacteria bacterium]
MKRIHIHVGVEKLEESIRFYSAMFGAEPVKTKPDYAKWMLDNPRVNFAISTRASKNGIDHLGIQVDENDELEELRRRVKAADLAVFDEDATVCCYANSEKSWVQDPAGIVWEAYRTMDDGQIFSSMGASDESACCTEQSVSKAGCCAPSEKTTGCCG